MYLWKQLIFLICLLAKLALPTEQWMVGRMKIGQRKGRCSQAHPVDAAQFVVNIAG